MRLFCFHCQRSGAFWDGRRQSISGTRPGRGNSVEGCVLHPEQCGLKQ